MFHFNHLIKPYYSKNYFQTNHGIFYAIRILDIVKVLEMDFI